MRTIYIDMFSGVAGDMLLGALLDAGLPEADLRSALARLPVGGYRLDISRTTRMGLAATRAEVHLVGEGEHAHPHGPGHDHAHDHRRDDDYDLPPDSFGHEHSHDHHHDDDDEDHPHGHPHDAPGHTHPHDDEHPHGHAHDAPSQDHPHGHHHDEDAAQLDHDHAHAGEGQGGDDHGRPARHLPEILELIAAASLPGRAAERASAVFRRLAEAEAKVHGTTPEQVHFHEVGAVDAIVDIVGVCAGLALLGDPRVVASPLALGSGFVRCAHGRLPVPVPAVIELARGIPTAASDEPGELTTPTGAAIIVTLAERFGPMPAMVAESVGYGAGSRQGKTAPNVVRVILGHEVAGATGGESGRAAGDPDAAESDTVWVLEANLDDATGETLGATTQALLDAGALDAWLVPVTMKKGRPGVILGCLADYARRAAVEDAIFRQTTTFGIRRTRAERTKLSRRHVEVATPFGPVRVKVGSRAGAVVTALPEYEDCLRLARERGVAFREVYDAARAAYGAGV